MYMVASINLVFPQMITYLMYEEIWDFIQVG